MGVTVLVSFTKWVAINSNYTTRKVFPEKPWLSEMRTLIALKSHCLYLIIIIFVNTNLRRAYIPCST